jgi:hypothetical protein
MKSIFIVLMLCGIMRGYAQNTPPHAASTRTWTFGEQIWSAAIQMPECNKTDFIKSDDEPDCRSYTTFYYYNWPYVNKNKAKMCPSSWRVPTEADMKTLVSNSNENALHDAWGYGGYAYDSAMLNVSTLAYYWSSMQNASGYAYELAYTSGYPGVNYAYKRYGQQVRCVK